MEPSRLERWRIDSSPNYSHFYTCARPGRSMYNYRKKDNSVSEPVIVKWIRNLPDPNAAIISLLGRKPKSNNISEFSYYPFCGGLDTPAERKNKPSFQEWLDEHSPSIGIIVREYPTLDTCTVPLKQLVAIEAAVCEFIAQDRTVVVVDSGGVGRIDQVRKFIGATEVPMRTPDFQPPWMTFKHRNG